MKKKLFFLCMVLSICIPCFAQTTFSAENPDGVSINYEITSDTTVAVSSGGSDNDGNLVIPDSVLHDESWYIVKTIKDEAFLNNSNLVSIEIPNLVTAIGKEAFSNCKNLVNISIGDSLKTIGDDAFKDCKNFSNIYVHNSDLFFYISCGEGQSNPFDYAEHLFVNNNEISELIIPNGITALSQRFFKKLGSNITSVTIPNSVKAIDRWAFNGWAKLEHITLGDSIKYFNNDAFFGFVSLKTVNVSSLEVLFNDYSFGRNANPFLIAEELCVDNVPITKLDVPNTVKEIKGGVFNGRNITALKVSDSVEKIGDNAFSNCKDLISVDLGQSVDTIFAEAFKYCSSIESIVIPNSVKAIEDGAFEGCAKLSSITLGDSVTFIGSNAFNGCDSLQRVEVTNLDAWYAIQFEDEKANPLTLAQHLYHNGEEITGLHIPDGIAEINEGFFSRFANVTSVVLPNSVKRIGDRAFQNLTNLQSVILNDSLETIGEQAFEKCTSLESITIPNSVKSIAQKAFSDCINISTVTLGDSLRVISKSSFSGCTLLDSITIPNSVVIIEELAFENCTNLTYISLGDSLKAIKHYAFKNCDSLIVNIPNINFLFGACVYDEYYSNPFEKAKELLLNKELVTELTIPNGVTEINRGFLYNLGRQINSVTMPNSLVTVKDYTFQGWSKLEHLTLGDSIRNFGYAAFHGCDSLTIKVAKLETLFNDFSFGGNNSNPFEKAVQLCLNDQPITELDVPNTIKEIKGGVFNGKNITTLTVSNSVEKIGDNAFSNCKDLISVDLGQSVDTIFAEAFRYCSNIESIVIPNSVTAIGYRAFEGCTKLSSITLGDSVTFIGSNAFNGCDSLQRVEVTNMDTWYAIQFENEKANPLTIAQHLYHNGEEVTGLHIPDGIAEINEGFFKGYENITSVVLPNSVKRIGDRAFRNLTNLKSVTLGNSLTTIGSLAFDNCISLSYISFGDSIRNFGNGAFQGCDSLAINVTKLETLFNDFSFGGNNSNPFEKATQLCVNDEPITELIVPNTINEIKGGVFNGKNITALKVSDSVEKIGTNAFSNCKELASIDLGQSVDTIFAEAFRYCSNIDSIAIPNSVKVIDDSAFEGCTKLSSITLGDSVTFIGSNAFNGCDSLQRVEVTNLDAWYAIQFENDKANPLTLAQHLYHNGEEVTGFHIPDGIAEINEGFFKGYENITSVVLPNSVRRIGYRAFKNLTNLKSVILGDSLKTIGREAFQGCTALESIIIPNSVTTIDGGVFEGCTKLSSITLGDSVKSIGHYAFNGCDKLSKVNVTNMANFCNIEFARHNSNGGNSNPLLIAKHLYLNDEKVTDLVIPNEVERIANYVFAGSDIISVSIPNSVHVIGDYAFRDCSSLTSVVIGDSVTTIGADAFWGCHELSYISLGESLDSIADGAFFACDSLIVNVTKIETLFKDYKFGSWSSNPFSCSIELCLNDEPIVNLEVPNTVTKIPGGRFSGRNITSVTIPNSVKIIENGAFANCSALTSIDIPNSVKVIGDAAFENCTELSMLSLGSSLDSIGVRAFAGCNALTSIEIPNSVRTISKEAFYECQFLTNVTLGNSIETIGEKAFSRCEELSSIEIPNSVKIISREAFESCPKLAKITLGHSIEIIESEAFNAIGYNLPSDQTISTYIPSVDWLFKVQINSFNNWHLIKNLYVGQQPLTSLEIPDNVKDVSILPLLYSGNSKITALHTGNGLKTLPEGRSEHITQVTLGSSVTKVESEFPNALIVVSNVSKAPTITENTFPKCMWDNGGDGVVVLLSPSDQNTYSKAKIWENMQLTNQSNQVEVNVATPGELDWEILQKSGIPAAKVVGLTVSGEINDKDFVQMKSNMKSLLYLDLTNAKITNIPNNALDSKQQLLSLALPNTVKTIGAYAFRGCSGIKELELPTDLEEIGEEAFTGINIETLDFNYALKKIGNRAFANTPLKEISFQNKVEVIGNEAFKGCNLQQELTFSDALISIGERAFEGHRGITGHLTIPDGVTSVGQSAFAGTSISTVFISGKMTTLESSVFADCDLLDVVYIPDNITRIKSSAFQGCESLKNLRLSQNIEVIEREAFRSIPIKSVNIPENVEKIDGYAFADCANLRFVTLPANIKSLDEGVFYNCRQLMNLTVKNPTPPTVKANTFRGVNIDKCIISIPTVAYKPYVLAEYWGRFVQMRNDIAVQMKGNGSISFASGDTMEDEEEASSRMMMATRAGEETEGTVTTVEDGSSLYVPQNGLVRFYITPANGEEIVSATFDGVDITAQIVDGVYETTADKKNANLVVNFSENTKTAQTITWEQEFEPMMVADKVTLNATASSGLVVTYEFADGESSERAELSDGIITILKSGNIALVAKQSGNEEYASATTDVKYIKAYAYGDANGNMEINSADLAVTVDYAIGNEPQEFFFRAADVNKDKNVNVADVSGVVDIVLSAPAATDNASGNAREFATSDNMVSILEGNSLNFYFTNKEEGFLTFQCDIRMAEGSMPELDITGNPIVAIRNKKGTGNHIAVARLLEDGCIRILVYSTDNTPIPSNYSFALSLENEPNDSDIEILNAGYSYRDSEQIAYGRLNCGVVTGLDSVMDEADQMDIKVNGNTISFYSATDCLMPIVSVNGISYMLNVKAGFNEFTVNKGVYVIGKNKVIIK